jgi:hypothetical protein
MGATILAEGLGMNPIAELRSWTESRGWRMGLPALRLSPRLGASAERGGLRRTEREKMAIRPQSTVAFHAVEVPAPSASLRAGYVPPKNGDTRWTTRLRTGYRQTFLG